MYDEYNKNKICDYCNCEGCPAIYDIHLTWEYKGGGTCSAYSCSEKLNCIEEKYCSSHTNNCSECKKEISRFDKYCDEHAKKCEECGRIISETERWCFDHKKKCEWSCSNRIPESGFCYEHKKKCEFEDCRNRISDYNNHCSQHPLQVQVEFYKEKKNKEKKRADDLQNQLNTANNDAKDKLTKKDEEINWLKNQIKMRMNNERYEAWVEETYLPRFRNN